MTKITEYKIDKFAIELLEKQGIGTLSPNRARSGPPG